MSWNDEHNRISHILILGTYTALVIALIAETFLMSWELWALPLIAAGVVISWGVHIRQKMTADQRLWLYSIFMMGTFFFYGIHVTSAYDMGLLMMIVMMIYTITGQASLVTLGQVTYYVTLAYDLIIMAKTGTVWDSLLISRTALHIVLVFIAGWLARFIIRQWTQMFQESDSRIRTLDKTAKRMNRFLANLSHELRTPVNAILGITNTLYDKAADPEVRHDLQTVFDAGSRMAEQISDIMDYSELETGNLVIHNESYTLSSLFNDLLSELRPYTPADLEVVIDIDADTPSAMISDAGKLRKILFHLIFNSLKYTREGGVYVHVSSVKQDYGVNLCVRVSDTGIGMTGEELEQISNRFYQAESGKLVRTGGLGLGLPIVYGFVRALGGFVMMESTPGQGTTTRISIPQKVADEKPCMSVADREKVNLGGYLNIGKFQNPNVREYYNSMILNIVKGLGTPMHRVNSISDLKELSSQIQLTHLFVGEEEYLSDPEYMERLSGEMSVILVAHSDSVLPSHTRMQFMPKPLYAFPVAAILNTSHSSARPANQRIIFPNVNALVVDDEPMNLHVAVGLLHKYEIRVTTASSGAEAIRLCREQPFDLIFMDHMMPEMDGIEAMKQIRQILAAENREVPVIALTANALSSARERFLREGFDGFVSKPIELPELERVMKRVLPKSAATSYIEENAKDLVSSGPASAETADAAAGSAAAALDALRAGGIDTEQGLRYSQQDVGFYFTIMRQFETEYEEKRSKLETFRQQKDHLNYAIIVHALKGTAQMIGASSLSVLAKDLESAAKKGQEKFLSEHHAAFLVEYGSVVHVIRENLPATDEDPGQDEVLEFMPDHFEDSFEFAPEGEE